MSFRSRAYRSEVFDPSRPLVVRRPFISSGRHMTPGDEFDWKRLSVSQRRARQIYDARKVEHPKAAVAPAPAPVPEPEPDPVAAQGDELDAIESLTDLRAIADEEGAPYKVSKADQRQAIRDHRG